METMFDDTLGSLMNCFAAIDCGAAFGPWASTLERRVADGTYMADAHMLARTFLAYLEELAGQD
jgi:hypothetical protein